MAKFAVFDEQGFPSGGFFDPDFHGEGNIPPEAVEITTNQWRAFLNNQGRRRWDGDSVVPYDPPEPEPQVPSVVTMRQAKLQLSREGMLATVEAAIAGMGGQAGEEARIEWAAASELRRDHYLVSALGAVLGLDNDRLDELFFAAAQIM